MDVNEALRSRYTCRDFKSTAVPKGTILEILDAAGRAPSWADTQPWEVFVAGGDSLEKLRKAYLDSFAKGVLPHPDIPAPTLWPPVLKQRMDELLILHKKEAQALSGNSKDPQAYLTRQMNFFNAPVVVFICMDAVLGPWSIFDLGFFTQSFLLAAREKGLDTAPAYRLISYPELVREELGIAPELSLVFGIAMGYGMERSDAIGFLSPRRNMGEVVRFKGFD
jgi:nitroreductase